MTDLLPDVACGVVAHWQVLAVEPVKLPIAFGEEHRVGATPRRTFPSLGHAALPLHVPHALNDLSVADAHDIDASNPVSFVLAPVKLPAEDSAVSHREDFLNFEDKVGRRRESLPEREAGLTTFVTCSIRGGRGIFENAAFSYEIIEVLGAMHPKCFVEAFHNFTGGVAFRRHFLPH